jgi:pSer/pThr/pTyr-binding forkhead associated (FHA) protein
MSEGPLAPFCEATGAAGPLRLSVQAPGAPEAVCQVFPQPFVVVGRGPQAHLVLDDDAVSRRHAYLQLIAGRVFCCDLQSRTGVHWDGAPRRFGWLDGRQGVGIGPFTIRLAAGDAPSPAAGAPGPLASRPVADDPLPPVTLAIRSGTSLNRAWRMDRVLALVGQSPRCKLRVCETRVSRFHCSLLRTPQGLWVIGLRPPHGVSVNGTDVPYALLAEGDELQVGGVRLVVRYGPAPASGTARVSTARTPGSELALPSGRALAPCTDGPPVWQEGCSPALTRSAATPQLALPVAPGAGGETTLVALGGAPGRTELEPLLVPLAHQLALMQQQTADQFTRAMVMMIERFSELHREQVGLIHEELERLGRATREVQAMQAELTKSRPEAGAPVHPANGAGRPTRTEGGGTTRLPSRAPGTAGSSSRSAGEGHKDMHALISERIERLQEERQGRWEAILRVLSNVVPS